MKRFRGAKSEEEERRMMEAIVPPNTRYSTKWAYNIFEEWKMNRENTAVINEPTTLGFDNKCQLQDLSTKVEDLEVESLSFWLAKFVQEVAKKNGERYPPRTLYCIICGINRHLAELRPKDSVNLVDKTDRR